MHFPSTCFVGRIISRQDRLAGLDWQSLCPVPAENILSVGGQPDMYFCSPHYEALQGQLRDAEHE